MKIEIKNRYGKVLFEHECEDNTIRKTLEEAVRRGAYLGGADLGGAYLEGADLKGAYLGGAYLEGADLKGAYLKGAYLGGAYLKGAYLKGAYLGGAYLGGAYLGGAYLEDWGKIQSLNDILIVGAIGSRSAYTSLFHTDKGIFVQCGCFKGSLEEFETKVKETHQGNKHEKDYLAMIEFAKKRFAE